jgi:hypothetical protein
MSVALTAEVPAGIVLRIASHPLEQGRIDRTVTL